MGKDNFAMLNGLCAGQYTRSGIYRSVMRLLFNGGSAADARVLITCDESVLSDLFQTCSPPHLSQ
jgi:hypothetical protein